LIRGQKVMIDRNLAELYGEPTKRINQQVQRNIERFPEDFMIQLSKTESESWRLQFATSKLGRGGRRSLPYAFTEQGVAMLSSVLSARRIFRLCSCYSSDFADPSVFTRRRNDPRVTK
jgi:hypothetical protein